MNDGMLSQDEIDALLNVTSDNKEPEDENKETKVEGNDSEQATDNKADVSKYLSPIEIDAIGEIGNISFGSSATTLSMLLNHKVEITTPTVSIIESDSLADEFTFKPVSVQVDYTEGFTGRNVFVIKAEDASIIADVMLGGDGTNPSEELSEISVSAVQEAMNQMMGTAATSMSTIFNKKVDISPPTVIDGSIVKEVKSIFDEDVYVKVFFRLIVGDLIDSNMMQLIPLNFAKELSDTLLNGDPANNNAQDEQEVEVEQPVVQEPVIEQAATVHHMEEPVREQQFVNQEPQRLGKKHDYNNVQMAEASFSQFEAPSLTSNEQRNLDMLMDINLKVTVELGKTKRTIRDILDLTSGSIVELDKLAGEPVDILVNGKLIAEGEVVVIEENFGVRVTDVISKTDRIMKLS